MVGDRLPLPKLTTHVIENKKARDVVVPIVASQVPADLDCSICGGLFDKAVSLKACGHVYCSVCIRNHWLTTSRPGVHHQAKKECPLCRAAVGNDVDRALVINRGVQEAVAAFQQTSTPPPSRERPRASLSSDLNGSKASNEAPITERLRSRNYAAMQRKGKKDLQKVCKEYGLPVSGNENDLIHRLRSFECMWNAELDTIFTPLTPSDLVAKFKTIEKAQRQEKSRDMMNGCLYDSKHMKKLASSLLDGGTKRNHKKVSSTSSGNASFDARFQAKFAALIAQGRKRMEASSSSSSSACIHNRDRIRRRRVYDDDCIHDRDREQDGDNATQGNNRINGNGVKLETTFKCSDVEGRTEATTPVTRVARFAERTRDDSKGSTKVGSSLALDLLSPKKKSTVAIHNPYQPKGKNKLLQDQSVPALTNTKKENLATVAQKLERQTSNTSPVASMPTLTPQSLRPPPTTAKETKTSIIYNPYTKKNIVLRRSAPPSHATTSHDITTVRNADALPLMPPNSSGLGFYNKPQNANYTQKHRPTQPPLVPANNIHTATTNIPSIEMNGKRSHGFRIGEIGSSSSGPDSSTWTTTARKNAIIYNPYKRKR